MTTPFMRKPCFSKNSMYQNNFGDITLKSKIDEISDAVEELSRGFGNDEKVFELGIELGKYLSATGAEFVRLPFYIQREVKRNKEERIREKTQKISNLILRLFYIACVKQVEKKGSITFDASTYWRGIGNIFDEEISQELFVICNSVEQEDEEQDFNIEFEVIGEMADLFDRYQARKKMGISAFNLNSSSTLTIDTAGELRNSFGKTRIYFDTSSSNLDEKQLDEMFEEIHKATLFLLMKYSAL